MKLFKSFNEFVNENYSYLNEGLVPPLAKSKLAWTDNGSSELTDMSRLPGRAQRSNLGGATVTVYNYEYNGNTLEICYTAINNKYFWAVNGGAFTPFTSVKAIETAVMTSYNENYSYLNESKLPLSTISSGNIKANADKVFNAVSKALSPRGYQLNKYFIDDMSMIITFKNDDRRLSTSLYYDSLLDSGYSPSDEMVFNIEQSNGMLIDVFPFSKAISVF